MMMRGFDGEAHADRASRGGAAERCTARRAPFGLQPQRRAQTGSRQKTSPTNRATQIQRHETARIDPAGRRNTRESSLAKWFATTGSERAAGDAVEIHGANGYSDEYPVGRYYRNCKGAVIYEGTREIHKIMQADYLLGYREDRPSRCELPAVERPQ